MVMNWKFIIIELFLTSDPFSTKSTKKSAKLAIWVKSECVKIVRYVSRKYYLEVGNLIILNLYVHTWTSPASIIGSGDF
jgi:hypothetical protein